MAIETTYSNARNNLAPLQGQVTDDREFVVIHWRGHDDVAIETAFGPTRNAQPRVRRNFVETPDAGTPHNLRRRR